MVNNALSDILLNWNKMSDEQKTSRLQALENMVARFQERRPRKIVTKINQQFITEHIGSYRLPSAYYSRQDSDYIYIIDLNCHQTEAVKNIIHEGIHAYFHDFVKGDIKTIKLYTPMNLEKFYIEEENLPAIREEFEQRHMMPLFDSFYLEERVNYQEDTMYMIKMILDLIENPADAMRLTESFVLSLDYAAENEKRGRTYESRYKMTYDDIVIAALNKDFDEKCEIVKTGSVHQIEMPELEKLFKKVIRFYGDYKNAADSLLMSDIMKEKVQRQAIDYVIEAYRIYVLRMLKEKKKI
jgi:hypothetical protein